MQCIAFRCVQCIAGGVWCNDATLQRCTELEMLQSCTLTVQAAVIGLHVGHMAVEKGATKGCHRVNAAVAILRQEDTVTVVPASGNERANAEGHAVLGDQRSRRSKQEGPRPGEVVHAGSVLGDNTRQVAGDQVARDVAATDGTSIARALNPLEAEFGARVVKDRKGQPGHTFPSHMDKTEDPSQLPGPVLP